MYVKSGFSSCRMSQYECVMKFWFLEYVSRVNNVYIFSIYRNPDLDDSIYDCLLSSIASIQSKDVKSSIIFVGDFNAHHREWLSSISPTNTHGRSAYDFSNVSGCTQLVNEPTHESGNRLDLLFTDVPGIVDVSVSAPVGTSDHNSLSEVVSSNISISKVNFKYSGTHL